MHEIGKHTDSSAKVDELATLALSIEREIARQAPGRKECSGSTVDVVCAFMPVLKDEIALVLCQPILGQNSFGFGVGLALRFGELRHDQRSISGTKILGLLRSIRTAKPLIRMPKTLGSLICSNCGSRTGRAIVKRSATALMVWLGETLSPSLSSLSTAE
ncbi:hypothetical protein [Sinorhizobium meliloti]|uniref:hypothetical protein n=1 Tax=Rhizobium meliloti TaxID=382 RepID=UPI001F227333|nr:hypothetical protein [Sinorhizobium meliloti]